jgi:diguanylate cyclase (GGDEF)-like protein/PAS domain S-box-containing protein
MTMSFPPRPRALHGADDLVLPLRWRILVVDDEPLLRDSVVALLAAPDRELHAAGTAAEALATLRARRFDLALLDIGLPDMTGLELLDKVRASGGGDLRVVIVSGNDSIESAISALRLGVSEFVRKPYSPAALREVVQRQLSGLRLERENQRMREALAYSEQLHRYFVEHSPDLIYLLDAEGRFDYVNDRFEHLLGYRKSVLTGAHFSTVVHPEDLGRAEGCFNERRAGDRAARNVELRLLCGPHRGAPLPASSHLTVVLSASGLYSQPSPADPQPRFLGTYGAARDITERKRAEEAIAFHAFHDSLTGLPNRALFRNRLGLAIASARRGRSMVGVLFIDLDRFKQVNDSFGHVVGDRFLQAVADRLRHTLREIDTLARLGGDEFTVILPEMHGPEAAATVARKIAAALERPFDVDGAEIETRASVGIAVYPLHGAGEDELLSHADIAMYSVKRRGKDGIATFEPAMAAASGAYTGLEHELRRALRRDELEVHYQPVVETSTGKVPRVEALVRWRHPTEGLLGPSRFIHVAEETGLVRDLGAAVFDKSLERIAAWRREGLPDLGLAVNVSPRQLERPEFVRDLVRRLSDHALPPDALEMEITENVLIEDVDMAVERVHELRRAGIRVSIDDFGTRYSSLGYLQRLPVNTIKIDQSFVRHLSHARTSSPIVSAMVAIAKAFSFELVAEGVEVPADLAALRALGCDMMQGYYFRAPESAEHLTPYLLAAS